jgi:CheY-like chemotaxis protein
MQPEAVELGSIVSGLETLLLRTLDERIRLQVNIGQPELWIEADRGQVEQALLNLALNSRDAMPSGGELTISCDRVEAGAAELPSDATERSYCRLSVADNGCGMDLETQTRAFEPLYTTKDVRQGSGMGLSNVYGIASRWGGFAKLQSEMGTGTRIDVYFPHIERPATSPPQVAKRSARPAQATILVVEDQEAIRAGLASVLAAGGHTAVTAADAAEAMRLLAEPGRHFDLLLTDIRMPDMSGRALAERVKVLAPSVSIVYMSGYAGEEEITDGNPFLAKPFTPAQLLATVDTVLESERPAGP